MWLCISTHSENYFDLGLRNHSSDSDNITCQPSNYSTSFLFVVVFRMPRVLRYIDMVPTVRLTSTGNQILGNQEFCLAHSETMIEQVKKRAYQGKEDEDNGSYAWS